MMVSIHIQFMVVALFIDNSGALGPHHGLSDKRTSRPKGGGLQENSVAPDCDCSLHFAKR